MVRQAVVWAAVLLSAATALADGGYFELVEFVGTAWSVDQRAVIVYEEGAETLLLQTRYEGDPGDFAWVIPTPGLVSRAEVAEGDETVFDVLENLTAPRAYVEDHGGGCWGYGCASEGGAGDGGTYNAVNVWDQFSVGGYDVSVLSAEDSAELATWLADNGYKVPASAGETIAHYTDKDWYFVAVKVHQAQQSGGIGGGRERMQPLRIRFAADTPVFPMRISSVSTREQVGVQLYTLAPHRMRGTNYNTGPVRLQRPFDPDAEAFDDYYESQLRLTTDTLGVRSLAVEYAGPLPGPELTAIQDALGLAKGGEYYVTRLSTFIEPENMTQDVELAYAASDTSFRVTSGSSSTQIASVKLSFVGLWLVGLTLHARDRRGRSRKWRPALLLATVLIALAV